MSWLSDLIERWRKRPPKPPVIPPVPPVNPPGNSTLEAKRSLLLDSTTYHRSTKQLPRYSRHPILDDVAQRHTIWMAAQGKLDHQDSFGGWPWNRIENAGYGQRSSSENIGQGYETAEQMIAGWMASKGGDGQGGHWANIMDGAVPGKAQGFTHVGYGYAYSPLPDLRYGRHFWTMLVASPRTGAEAYLSYSAIDGILPPGLRKA